MESVKRSIIKCKEEITEAFNSGDFKGVVKHYINGAKFFPPNRNAVQGVDRIEAFWRIIMSRGIRKAEFETVNIEVSGATAFEIGNYLLFLEKGQIADFGEYVAIWRNKDSEWKLYLHQWDSDISADINENSNTRINQDIIKACELSNIGCSYINFDTVKCDKCLC